MRVTMRTCQSCGRENPLERDFCECGEYLRWELTGSMTAVPPEQPSQLPADESPQAPVAPPPPAPVEPTGPQGTQIMNAPPAPVPAAVPPAAAAAPAPGA